jgi:hypothetical protein
MHLPFKRLLPGLLLSLCVTAFVAPASAGIVWRVTVDTTPLNGSSGYVALDFTAGDAAAVNQAVISAFASDAALGSSTPTGNATGSLVPGPLTLGGPAFFSSWLQQVSSFGDSFSFLLDLGATPPAGTTPDGFALFLLDADLLPYETGDPTGADALFAFDLSGPDMQPQVFGSAWATASVVRIQTPPPGAVPVPTTLALALLGCAVLVGARRT